MAERQVWEPEHEEVRNFMLVDRKYPVPARMYDKAKKWLQEVSTQGYFVMAFMIPYDWNGVSGIVLATSTRESNRVSGLPPNEVGMTHDPEWLYYDAWWYRGLCMLNFAGLAKSYYWPVYLGRFEDFLHEAFVLPQINILT